MRLSDYLGRFWTGAEVMYGVIIAMTFTSVFRSSPVIFDAVIPKIVLAALFCCIAWGIADGLFYFWERNYIIRRENMTIQLSKSGQNEPALSLIGEQLDDTILRTIPENQRLTLYEKLVQFLSTVEAREKVPWQAALTIILGTFVLSAGAGLVVVSPFFFLDDARQALGVSNLLGIVLLFIVGYMRALDRNVLMKVMFGIGSSLIGIIIAGITVVLGG
jgi:hypothetical protein